MYLPRSFYSDLGDVEVIERDGILHLFHLVLPNRDLIAHAISRDGLSWKACAPAIRTGDPGEMDDDMIRTISVTKRDDLYYMLYTATSRQEAGRVERTGLAISKDLYSWEKYPERIVAQADPKYYETELSKTRAIAFRDPKPLEVDGKYYCTVCARAALGPRFRKGCAALMVSDDLIHWEAKAPLFMPGLFDEVECPQLYRIGEYFYLFGSIIEEQTQRYWISKNIDGPFYTPSNSQLFPVHSHYAGRLCRFAGKDIFACWTSCIQDGDHPFGLRTVLGEPIRYVPSILEVHQNPDGTLHMASWQGWDNYQKKKTPLTDLQWIWGNISGELKQNQNNLTLSSQEGFSLYADSENHESFTLNGKLKLSTGEAGLFFRGDDQAGGYFIRFRPAEYRAALIRHTNHPEQDRFCYQVMQESPCSALDRWVPFQLRSIGAEIEFSLDGHILFSTVSSTRLSGRIGCYAICGEFLLSDLELISMRQPENQ